MNKYFILSIVIIFMVSTLSAEDLTPELREGDILFQDFYTPQSAAIKLATGSKYTHCGILFFDDTTPKVWEAVQPVCITPLQEWVARDTSGHFVVKRLKGVDSLLMPKVIEEMKKYALYHLDKNYDIYFNWSDTELYCSEYIYKIFSNAACIELAPLNKLGEYDLSHPIVKQILNERYGDSIPVDEPVISPGDLFNSPLLDTVLVK